jgi:hypothetical protein
MSEPAPVDPKPRKRKNHSHPDCETCSKKKSLSDNTPSNWIKYLQNFRLQNPSMSVTESIIEARKSYVPANGKLKSYERLWTEVWKARNPTWKVTLSKDEAKKKMREDFLLKI